MRLYLIRHADPGKIAAWNVPGQVVRANSAACLPVTPSGIVANCD